jgi:hypothetical protein
VNRGGFEPVAFDEDVALVASLERSGARIAWMSTPKALTSARPASRARGYFGKD